MKFLQDDNTIDVISPLVVNDYGLFFGPLTDGPGPCVLEARRASDILVHLGLAQSRGWCRKNNWDFPLTDGYSEFVFGSKRIKVCILIPWKGHDETLNAGS